ncbi:MAG: hypothetical protein MZV64_56965 [Ignavibacteriales bacterium]|nr:hypothetical protein [Ignavibacteriales bacterium]
MIHKSSDKDFALSYRGGLLEDDSFNSRNVVLFPLRYSKEEIQNLNSMFSNGFALLSDDATEKNFKENAAQKQYYTFINTLIPYIKISRLLFSHRMKISKKMVILKEVKYCS